MTLDKFLGYPLLAQLRDIFPTIAFSALTGAVLHLLAPFFPPGFFNLAVLCTVGGIVYLGLHFWRKTEEYLLIQRVILPKTMGLIAKLF